MEKPSDEKPDDLEIASIGSLYCGGNWDKKYWSSSRVRFPSHEKIRVFFFFPNSLHNFLLAACNLFIIDCLGLAIFKLLHCLFF